LQISTAVGQTLADLIFQDVFVMGPELDDLTDNSEVRVEACDHYGQDRSTVPLLLKITREETLASN